MNAMESAPSFVLNSDSLLATRPMASSQLAWRNLPSSRINGVVNRSSLLMCPQPNFPFTQVEIPLAGPCSGATLRMWRSFVQTSKLQPTPQYVQTVFVLRIRCSRIACSASETWRMLPKPVSGSTPLTTSIMPPKASFFRDVRNPACPSIVFSIRALQGQTVTQCPHETQLDSPIVDPPSQSTRGFGSSQLIDKVSFTSTF